jgi:DNA polymerase V
MYGLIDCNHFYVSCERVFNPRLEGKPVVVLSGENGCIVTRSPEAKKLGIPMGEAAFKFRELFINCRVIALTSNFSLYADFSSRVMQIIEESFPDIEVYSIDEAFIKLDESVSLQEVQDLRTRILKWTGIPVSIGLAETKTLAKVATDYAKKMNKDQVFKMGAEQVPAILKETPLQDIWGIGRRISASLKRQGLYTAWDFMQMDDAWIRRQLGVVGLRMALELRGTSCLDIQEDVPPKKSILCSRSFTQPITEFEELAEAASSFIARVAEKLREQDSVASFVEVFIQSNPFKEETFYGNHILIRLPELSSYTPLLIHYVKEGLKQIYKPHILYKKVGVMVGGIEQAAHYQRTLFETDPAMKSKQEAVMQIMDQLNRSRRSQKTLFLAAEGVEGPWTYKESTTSRFTSQWDELLKVKAC